MRASCQLPPKSPVSPTRAKAVTKRAPSAARRRSAASAREKPAPAAAPFTTAMVGLGISASRREVSSKRRSWAALASGSRASPAPMPRRSPPEQKARPAPVSTTQRTASSSAASRTRPSSASSSSPLMALSASGRFSVTVATAPSVS